MAAFADKAIKTVYRPASSNPVIFNASYGM